MSVGFEFSVDGEGVVTLSFSEPMDGPMFSRLLLDVPQRLPNYDGKLQIDRRGQKVSASLPNAIEFGKAFGKALLMRGAKVAVLQSDRQVTDAIIAAQVYNAGVPLAQFDRPSEARDWLVGSLN